MIEKKRKILIVLIAAVFLILFSGGVFYYSQNLKQNQEVNYLIPGVPYNGIYNLFFRKADSPIISSALDVLGYWGDERFKAGDLFYGVFNPKKMEDPASLVVKRFFEDSGYEAYFLTLPQSDRSPIIKEIKKFVNPDKKIPVIVFQRHYFIDDVLSPNPIVVIGVFDNEQKVIIHDHYLGNNYAMSYQDLEKTFSGYSPAILAVWPSDGIQDKTASPNYDNPYPERMASMDELGNLLMTKWAKAMLYYNWYRDFEKSNQAYKEFIDNQNFKSFPPAFQVSVLTSLAQTYNDLKKFDEAIKVINERALPLNHNLGQNPEGWYVPAAADEFPMPYYELSFAYFKKGQKSLALSSYRKYKQAEQAFNVRKLSDTFVFPQIPELEKEILKN